MIKEFKEFINRGNLIDVAVGFVMGVAFSAIITSFTNDIIGPIVAKVFDVQDLSEWVVSDIRVGAFLVAVINFLIVALVLFFIVKAYNRMRKEAEDVIEEPTEEVLLLREIRDGVTSKS